ncbi:bifunctional HAT (Half-A-TPR) repeat/Suppressor of forked/rRNA biogenesis protein Rrp5/Tetratricopeptide-like helical domain superfamily [Babesia duncani]|uniref:Bifunctional HAT (Half-A-TPR) repeat/Suppressor of forked/rRNA biogenesis protein Rrp5/Tetratricopeptide-like helical domain superfamily n=1 Tax=Babesia duncani TaxID=323732 RepID=A0AAD9UPT3_9APIC|nr:bifunctional HAT (Half-A-TPR) repeat/Suppressor of forked/rRNA biogenesis protein Rrp5/Tetratricopeptide-like helical domain superfamily [Babesia duncani]
MANVKSQNFGAREASRASKALPWEPLVSKKVEKSQSKKKRKRPKSQILTSDPKKEFETEAHIRKVEQRIAEGEWEKNPESEMDFEKLVAVKGGSSTVWIRYMAYYLQRDDIEMARAVVKRGLERIDFREMQEKQNLWLAYLNMECSFGDDVMKIFTQAIRFNDAHVMHLKMIGIFIANRKFDEAREICHRGIKKFYSSREVCVMLHWKFQIWLAYLRLEFEHVKDPEAGRDVYTKCIARIPAAMKIDISSAVALLEFKFGSPERGQVIFENILLDNPKRMDIWTQYINAYIKMHLSDESKSRAESLRQIRNLFQRSISLDLKPKKMKSLFKRWLEFEHLHGNEKSQQHVQRRALEYVEARPKESHANRGFGETALGSGHRNARRGVESLGTIDVWANWASL